MVDEISKTIKEGKEEKSEKTATITLLVGVGKKVEDKEFKTEKYYARREGEKDVVMIPARNVDSLLKLVQQPDALRDRHLVRLESSMKPDALNVTYNPARPPLEFRHPDTKPWQLWQGDNEQKIDEGMVTALITMLTERNKSITFLDPRTKDSEVGLDKPGARVELWVDGIAKEEKKEDKDEKKEDKDKKDEKDKKDNKKDASKEKKDDKPAKPKLKAPAKPTVKLTFASAGRMATDVVVKREVLSEEPEKPPTVTLMRVPVVIYDRVTEGPLAYLDRSLPKFSPSGEVTRDVTQLIYEQDGKVTEVTKERGDNKPWKIVKPTDLAGREANPLTLSVLLEHLNRLRAVKLVADKGTPEYEKKLKESGLETPSARATLIVSPEGKPIKYEYLFGKEESPGFLYAKRGNSDLIFTVHKSDIAPFKDDLLTRTVFKFESDKVKSVKLTGWKKVTGVQTTLEVEKDGSGWKIKAPEGFKVDSSKITTLVDGLANLQLEKYVSHGKKPAPDQELDVADRRAADRDCR